MPNFEQLLPYFNSYQTILTEEGYSFNDGMVKEVRDLFDQTKWEDRLLMLTFIMQRSKLKVDNRPPFSKWIKGEIDKIETDTLDYNYPSNRDKGAQDPYLKAIERYSVAKDKINKDSLKKIIEKWDTYSYDEVRDKLTLNLMGVYHTLFPESMVETTPIGKKCLSLCKQLSQTELVKEYIDGLYFSLASFSENAHTKMTSLKKSNENLYLHKYDFNWSDVLHLVWKIDMISWWYREYLSDYDPCWKMDITSIPLSIGTFDNSNSYLTECLVPMLFNAYGVDCKEYNRHCYTRMFSWYSGEYSYNEQDMEENIEDQWAEIHQQWTKEYGVL